MVEHPDFYSQEAAGIHLMNEAGDAWDVHAPVPLAQIE
jgi:hypothetical protein